MKLHEYKGLGKGDVLRGQVGLEIETETNDPYDMPQDMRLFWTQHQDGSLRHYGMEYVLTRPLDVGSEKYNDALAQFHELSKRVKFLDSPYTSVHVHLNMMDKDLIHMMNFITLYFLFEEVLGEYCGNARNGNLFCLKTSTAEETYRRVVTLAEAIEEGTGLEAMRNLNNDILKYSGLNIVPLRTLGSLEVRTHPGTADIAMIDRWVRILNQLYTKADTFLSPVEILTRLIGDRSKLSFAERIFEGYEQYLPMTDLDRKMHDGIWYSAALGRAVKNWKDFGTKKSTKRKTSKWDLDVDEQPRVTPTTIGEEEYRRLVEIAARDVARMPRVMPAPAAVPTSVTFTTQGTTAGPNFNWIRTREDT